MKLSRAARIRATIQVPPDKSLSHRSLILNAIATGTATVERILDSEDVRSTAHCLRALGVEIDWSDEGATARITGRGLHGLFEADDVLDCGNSGTSMRLLSGLLAGQPILSVLSGDASLRSRPMGRVITPLKRMGAAIVARKADTLAPLTIRGGGLRAVDYASPVASAQVKSAVLLAGLYADGETRLTEPERSRDHTERMLSAMGVALTTHKTTVAIQPPARLEPLSLRVPGDISSAAPWLVLAAIHPDAEIHLQGVNVNPTRTGLLDILAAMGAEVELSEERNTGGEPVADLTMRTSRLRPTTVGGSLVPRAIDELTLVALLGAFAEGETVVKDASELIVKESNRVEAMVNILRPMGVDVVARPDGFIVRGPCALRGAHVDALGDHRMGMLAGVAAMLASSDTVVDRDAVGVSYPGFWSDLRAATGQ